MQEVKSNKAVLETDIANPKENFLEHLSFVREKYMREKERNTMREVRM